MSPRLLVAALLVLVPLAGCVSSPEEPAAAADPLPAPPAPAAVPVALEGSFGLQVMACPFVVCVGPALRGETVRVFEQDVPAGPVEVNLTMTWDPSSPLMEELFFGVFSCPAECRSDADITEFAYVEGKSPLYLSEAAFPLAQGETLHVFANAPNRMPLGGFLMLTTEQAFTVEGSLAPAA